MRPRIDEAARAKFGDNWNEFLANVRTIRREGRAVSRGEVDSGLVGVSVPMVELAQETPISLGLAMSETRFFTADMERLVSLLKTKAGEIVRSMVSARESPSAEPALHSTDDGDVARKSSRPRVGHRK